MILDVAATPWPASAKSPDIAIIGAGAAGITLAHALADSGLRILVLEAGGAQVTPVGDAGTLVSGFGKRTFHQSLGRGLGGTTAMWAGQVLPLEPFDLSERSWLPLSGWPIDYDELEPYYRRAEAVLNLPPATSEAEFPPSDAWRPILESGSLELRYSQFARQPNMATLYQDDLAKAPRVTLLLNAAATRVRLEPSQRALEGVEVALPDRTRRNVSVRTVVVCCSGVESTRLLLASLPNDPPPWPGRHLVGRCFQDHAHVGLPLRTARPSAVASAFNSRMVSGRRMFPKLIATPGYQKRESVLSLGSDLAYQASEQSPVVAAKTLLRAARDPSARSQAPEALLNLAKRPQGVARALHGRLRHGFKFSEGDGVMLVGIQAETAPNLDSNITLTRKADALGVACAEVRWWVGELERRSIRTFAGTLRKAFEHAALGDIDDRLPSLADDHGWMERVNPGHHHLGTLRMASDPNQGVVDRDCRVHGVEGLFVASGAVFPTGGFGNPTLTILALALRLADHLALGARGGQG